MNIEEFTDAFYEDLNGRITAVTGSPEKLCISFECDDWNDFDKLLQFQFTCLGVVENTVWPGDCINVRYLEEHITLLDHNSEQGMLYFSSVPQNRHEIIGILHTVHEEIMQGWKPLNKYLNHIYPRSFVELLNSGNGLLASGPIILLENYARSLNPYLKINITKSLRQPKDKRVLLFDGCYVVCDEVKLNHL